MLFLASDQLLLCAVTTTKTCACGFVYPVQLATPSLNNLIVYLVDVGYLHELRDTVLAKTVGNALTKDLAQTLGDKSLVVRADLTQVRNNKLVRNILTARL